MAEAAAIKALQRRIDNILETDLAIDKKKGKGGEVAAEDVDLDDFQRCKKMLARDMANVRQAFCLDHSYSVMKFRCICHPV